jgi:hypothetical protein
MTTAPDGNRLDEAGILSADFSTGARAGAHIRSRRRETHRCR